MSIEDEVAPKKGATMDDLLAELQAQQSKAQAAIAAGLFDLRTKIRGKDAHVKLISLEQRDAISYSSLTFGKDGGGTVDAAKLAKSKPMLIAFAVCDANGAPIFAKPADVDLLPGVGNAVWNICARINRIGAYANSDPMTGEPLPGN